MIQSIRELKKQMRAQLREEQVGRDEEGRVVVELTVLHDDDFLSDFSAGNRPVISSEVAEFLNERVSAYPPQEPMNLKIYSKCIDSEEQTVYSAALKEYYVRHYIENKREMRRNAILSAIMAAVGILVLVVAISFHILEIPVVSEVIDIFAWVFLWEAVDMFFFQRSVLRRERTRCLRMIDAKIEFLSV